jgi:hypothetical protein
MNWNTFSTSDLNQQGLISDLDEKQIQQEFELVEFIAEKDKKRLKELQKTSEKLSTWETLSLKLPVTLTFEFSRVFDGEEVETTHSEAFEIIDSRELEKAVDKMINKALKSQEVKDFKKQFAEEVKKFKSEAMKMIKEHAKSMGIKDKAVIDSAFKTLFNFI